MPCAYLRRGRRPGCSAQLALQKAVELVEHVLGGRGAASDRRDWCRSHGRSSRRARCGPGIEITQQCVERRFDAAARQRCASRRVHGRGCNRWRRPRRCRRALVGEHGLEWIILPDDAGQLGVGDPALVTAMAEFQVQLNAEAKAKGERLR